ncbi:MAG TPA: hypothetical protein VMN99_12785 [Anaerolineales bacterium]|nr:hypothetical protein [Anaerolineales bacterium]
MKSTTYARLALFLPYLLLLEAVIYLYLQNPDAAGEGTLYGINLVWFFLAIFWIVPYSILVILLLTWSKSKSIQKIKKAYTLAPFALVIITLITYAIIYVATSLYNGGFLEGFGAFAAISLISIPADLVLGYLFVGIALLLFRLLTKIGFIKDHEAQETAVELSSTIPPTYSSEDGPRV